MASQQPPPPSIHDDRAISAIRHLESSTAHHTTSTLPQTSAARLSSSSEDETILYLAYGSNLCAETFRGKRGIRPLSAINVHVPSLTLTFDLAGIAYIEPCFANTGYRIPPPGEKPFPHDPKYGDERWKKGLVGVLYEVTPVDYRTIMATEGGGASYDDVVVPCYPLAAGLSSTPDVPEGKPVLGHTLMCPRDGPRLVRPYPAYAQPSHRYLKLLIDGAEEHGLPQDYAAYLSELRGFTMTQLRQKVGRVLWVAMWGPPMLLMLGVGKLIADKQGRFPPWLAKVSGFLSSTMWRVYDLGFKQTWGDGERTIGDVDGVLDLEQGKISLK